MFQVVAGHRVANVDVEGPGSAQTGILSQASSRNGARSACPCPPGWINGHPRGLGARRPTRREAERRNSVAKSVRFTGAFNLYQYGLTSSQMAV